MAVESSNTITARPQSGTVAWKWWQDVATRGTIQSRQAHVCCRTWVCSYSCCPTQAAVQPRELIATQPSTSQSFLTEQAYPEQSLTCAQREWVGSRAAAPNPGCTLLLFHSACAKGFAVCAWWALCSGNLIPCCSLLGTARFHSQLSPHVKRTFILNVHI